jgi:epoxyqueuosine reductase
MMTSAQVKQRAREVGLDLCGIAAAGDIADLARLPEWLARGFGGRMTYLNRTARRRADIRRWLPGARSVVVAAALYNTDEAHHVDLAGPSRARIARYAWGDDYHEVVGRRLDRLTRWMRAEAGPGFDARWCVDHGPVQEKVYARAAGIGWIGKNTCVIHPERGSWFVLGVAATTAELEPDEPALDRCGSCRLCIEACPSGAIVAPYLLDARRCLSYLTIEIRGAIPEDQRPDLGSHVFGCDICQDVCPFNALAPVAGDDCWKPRPALAAATIEGLWQMDDASLDQAIDGTALRRAGVKGLRRNLAVALGNAGQEMGSDTVSSASEIVSDAIPDERRPSLKDPMVAEHVRWARSRAG